MPLNCKLAPELEAFVHAQVASGRFSSTDDVIGAGLRALADMDHVHASIEEGLADIEAGRVFDIDTVFEELEHEIEEIARKRSG